MKLEKLAPWNWFKDEEHSEAKSVPVRQNNQAVHTSGLQKELDEFFGGVLRRFGFPSLLNDSLVSSFRDASMLKPNLDISSSEDKYEISVEVPGVKSEDIELELNGRRLVIRGEKNHEEKTDGKDFHRIERSYGSFQRVLTLPEDSKLDTIDAKSKDGVLTISIEKDKDKSESSNVRKINING